MSPPTVEDLEALRVPLTAYCYRLLGAAADTDDAVQEAIVRAHLARQRFDPTRGVLQAWVFRIATNVCLDMVRSARRRAVCVDLGPAAAPGAELGQPLPADRFVEPMPDARLLAGREPAEIVIERESVRLAVVAALQRLAPRQRATLVLRDVLGFSAAETADILGTTTASVTSALQRSRATLARHRPCPTDRLEPDDADQRDLLERYVAAFEAHDPKRLVALLCEDARASMPPFSWWVEGGRTLADLIGAGSCEGARLVPTGVNGQPGFGQYRPDDDGVLRPFAIVLVEPRGDRIDHITTFLGTAARFAEFGLPESFPAATDEFARAWS